MLRDKRISFIQFAGDECYRLKIWDDEIKSLPIYPGSTKTIGDYEGYSLELGTHTIFKRGLSFHSYQAYLESQSTDKLLQLQCMYGSPGKYPYKSQLDLMRTDCLKQIEEEADNGCSETPQFRVASKNDVLAHFHQPSVEDKCVL